MPGTAFMQAVLFGSSTAWRGTEWNRRALLFFRPAFAQLLPHQRGDALSEEIDRVQGFFMGQRAGAHLDVDAGDAAQDFIYIDDLTQGYIISCFYSLSRLPMQFYIVCERNT